MFQLTKFNNLDFRGLNLKIVSLIMLTTIIHPGHPGHMDQMSYFFQVLIKQFILCWRLKALKLTHFPPFADLFSETISKYIPTADTSIYLFLNYNVEQMTAIRDSRFFVPPEWYLIYVPLKRRVVGCFVSVPLTWIFLLTSSVLSSRTWHGFLLLFLFIVCCCPVSAPYVCYFIFSQLKIMFDIFN